MSGWETWSYQKRFEGSNQVCGGTQGRTGGVSGSAGTPTRGVRLLGHESLN